MWKSVCKREQQQLTEIELELDGLQACKKKPKQNFLVVRPMYYVVVVLCCTLEDITGT